MGQPVIGTRPTLESLGTFVGGLAVASTSRRFGHVDRRGAWVVHPEWQAAGAFSEGFAWGLPDPRRRSALARFLAPWWSDHEQSHRRS